jgi:L-asparaginase
VSHSESSKLAVLGLGGTIAMKQAASGAVPALSAEDLVEEIAEPLREHLRHVENFRRVPGAHLELADLVSLAGRIRQLAVADAINGFVVVQGTDTIEETVFALDLLCSGPPPVIVTGAMRYAGQTSGDGPLNLDNSLCVAAAPEAKDRGAMVCFNDEIHAAWAVQKTATSNVAAFSSPGFGPLGHVIEGRAIFSLRSERRLPIDANPEAIEPARIAILAAALGEGPDLVGCVEDKGYQGLVVQAMGAGHLPARWVEPLSRLAAEMPVVLASRVSRGPLLEATYAFPGSESDLLARGLLSAGYLTPAKARILLSLALGAGLKRDRVQQLFGGYR